MSINLGKSCQQNNVANDGPNLGYHGSCISNDLFPGQGSIRAATETSDTPRCPVRLPKTPPACPWQTSTKPTRSAACWGRLDSHLAGPNGGYVVTKAMGRWTFFFSSSSWTAHKDLFPLHVVFFRFEIGQSTDWTVLDLWILGT